MLLLDNGANPDVVDSEGWYMLQFVWFLVQIVFFKE